MIILNNSIDCEKGSVAIEAVFVLMFFSGLFIYSFQQSYVMMLTVSAEKTASQLVVLISQRSTLFYNKNLRSEDVAQVRKHIPAIADSNQDFFDVYIEEMSYQNGNYQVVHLPSSSGVQCTLRKPLSDYNIDIRTSFAKRNSVYRVTVCRKINGIFYSADDFVSGSSTVMPGVHH
ncbi:hypothetical protein HQN64_23850 [Enterobacteriaceae bacterium BIT-l23]|uniref:tight adherence pilus pseudopilin TadF n=1 Tax=Jejubacter sp. L23 TaxID=3092086 RepID=UPI0015848F6C|nr:hypothetical protein [Enterobacteriaceae bacterium BIT-l23]